MPTSEPEGQNGASSSISRSARARSLIWPLRPADKIDNVKLLGEMKKRHQETRGATTGLQEPESRRGEKTIPSRDCLVRLSRLAHDRR